MSPASAGPPTGTRHRRSSRSLASPWTWTLVRRVLVIGCRRDRSTPSKTTACASPGTVWFFAIRLSVRVTALCRGCSSSSTMPTASPSSEQGGRHDDETSERAALVEIADALAVCPEDILEKGGTLPNRRSCRPPKATPLSAGERRALRWLHSPVCLRPDSGPC